MTEQNVSRQGVFIHDTAEVDSRAVIGDGTKIWNNAQVREYTTIGANCVISKDVYIDHHVSIGDGTKIQNGVSVYHGVTVEKDVFLGPHMTFTNDINPRAFAKKGFVVQTSVEQGASLGAHVTVVCGVTIGKYSFAGAAAVITKDVPAHAMVVGNPARIVGYICKCGEILVKTKEQMPQGTRLKCAACHEDVVL